MVGVAGFELELFRPVVFSSSDSVQFRSISCQISPSFRFFCFGLKGKNKGKSFVDGLDELFHPGCAVPLHLLRYMGVGIQSKGGCGVA